MMVRIRERLNGSLRFISWTVLGTAISIGFSAGISYGIVNYRQSALEEFVKEHKVYTEEKRKEIESLEIQISVENERYKNIETKLNEIKSLLEKHMNKEIKNGVE
jgi:hypothetical protein